ncbi:MAG: glycosyltransferase [bacterium]
MNKKKIVLMIDSLVAGGAQRQMVLLAGQLKEAGYKPTILIYHDHMDLLADVEKDKINLKLIPKSEMSWPKLIWSITKFLKEIRPYVVISYLNTPNVISRIAGRLSGVKRIITSQRNLDLVHSRKRILLERLTQNISSFMVTNSEANRELIIKEFGFDTEKAVTIYNGVDMKYFSQKNAKTRADIRADWGIEEDAFVFLLPGRMEKQKNHIILVEAANIIDRNLRFKCVFAGHEFDKSIKSELSARIINYGLEDYFVFAGYCDNMPDVYTASDVVVLPSLWEGLPNVVIEALSCERPAIVTDVSDNSIIVSGEVGSVLPVNDAGALADAMTEYINMDMEQLKIKGTEGRRRIKELCSLKSFRNQYCELLERMA